MKCSIIVNTCNRADHLRRLLPGLRHLSGVEFEIVVVNGPSTDDTQAVLQDYERTIKTVSCPVMNLSVSRNLGIAAASGDFVVFIDDDAMPADDQWLKRYADAFSTDPALGGAGGAVLAYDSNDYEYLGGATTGYAFQRFDTFDPAATSPDGQPWVERAQGCNCAFRRSALAAIGGYDERFRFWLDETDVFYRLAQAGYTYIFLKDNPVRHYPTRTQFKMGLPPDKWSTITRSDTYFSLKNANDPLPLRLWKTIRYAPEKYYCRLIRGYAASGKLTRREQATLRFNWLQGLCAGIFYGLLTPRRTRNLDADPTPFHSCAALRSPASKMRIALLSQKLPHQSGCGGIGRYVYDLAKGLHTLGHEVHIICRDACTMRCETLEFVVHGIAEQEITAWSPLGKYPTENHNLCYSMAVAHRLSQLQQQTGPFDVVHAANWDAEALSLIRQETPPVVLTLVTSLACDVQEMQWDYNDEMRACIAMDYWQILHAHQLCSPSRGVLESYQELMNVPQDTIDAVTPVPLGIVPHTKANNAEEPTDEKTILFVGRCERRKGIHVLLDILPALLQAHPQWTCRIIGDDTIPDLNGRTFKESFLTTCPLELRERITFEGKVSDEQLYAAYQQCSIFVAPSLFESFGLIYLEAMQFGKPVIGCRTGGVPEVVRDAVDGILVTPGSADELHSALKELMADEKKRQIMGEFGRERVLETFTHIKMAERFEQVFRQVIDQNH